MKLNKFLHRLARDEKGQSTTEYILILAVVVMIAMKFKQEFGKRIVGITKGLTDEIEGAAKTSTE